MPRPKPSPHVSELNDLDLLHLGRMLRRERFFKIACLLHLLAAAGLGVYFSWAGIWSGTRAGLLVLLLMGARAHLRQVRSARLLRKLATGLQVLP